MSSIKLNCRFRMQVPSTRRATLSNRAFPVAAARAWNSLPPQTHAYFSIADISEGDPVSPFPSVVTRTADLALFT